MKTNTLRASRVWTILLSAALLLSMTVVASAAMHEKDGEKKHEHKESRKEQFLKDDEARPTLKRQRLDPASKKLIDMDVYVEKDGKRIYAADEQSREEIKKKFDQYAEQFDEDGVDISAPGKSQETCPVTGEKISKKHYVDKDGKRIYTCCPACKAKVKEKFDEYAKEFDEKGVELAKTPHKQRLCPVMGGKVNKDMYVEKDGKRIYVCCEACRPKVKEEFDKYAKMLESEGVKLEKAKEKK